MIAAPSLTIARLNSPPLLHQGLCHSGKSAPSWKTVGWIKPWTWQIIAYNPHKCGWIIHLHWQSVFAPMNTQLITAARWSNSCWSLKTSRHCLCASLRHKHPTGGIKVSRGWQDTVSHLSTAALKSWRKHLPCFSTDTVALQLCLSGFFLSAVMFSFLPYDSWSITCTLLKSTGSTQSKISPMLLLLLLELPGGSDCRTSIQQNSLFPFQEVRCKYVTSDSYVCIYFGADLWHLSLQLIPSCVCSPIRLRICTCARPALTHVSLWKRLCALERLHN